MVPTGFRLTKEPADAKLDPHRNSFPGQIVEPAAVSAMDPTRCLPALWTDTPLNSWRRTITSPLRPSANGHLVEFCHGFRR
jgi:hypothetical protein